MGQGHTRGYWNSAQGNQWPQAELGFHLKSLLLYCYYLGEEEALHQSLSPGVATEQAESTANTSLQPKGGREASFS